MRPEVLVAIYAAIVSTAVAALQIQSYFRSGVRLKLSLMADGMTIGGDPRFEEKDLVILTVTNRGDAPTTVENMVLFEITSLWQLWRIRPAKSYVIASPQLKGYPPNVPGNLEPAKKWTGAIRRQPDRISDLHTGVFYVGIYASHRDRPYLMRIPKAKNKLPKGTEAIA
jgi:hypothetical protein